MKPQISIFSSIAGSVVILTLPVFAQNEFINGNLTVTEWGKFGEGIDIGASSQYTLDWDALNSVVNNDINAIQGSFVWRDTYTLNNNIATARNKMFLSSSNQLTLYKSNGTTAGISFTPESSKITLADGVNGGIFFGANSAATLKAAANGSAVFPSSVTFQNGISLSSGQLVISSTTPSSSSSTGALTVSGGLGVAGDSYINGVRIGRGNGNISTNTALGNLAIQLCSTGIHNSAIGYASLHLTTTGSSNTAIGSHALLSNTTGSNNAATGVSSLYSNTTGKNNASIGTHAMNSNITGDNNSATGIQALGSNVSGNSNVAIGFSSGRYAASGTTPLADPENSIYIGANSRGNDNNDSNSIVIGANAVGLGANTTVIGNSDTTRTRLHGETNAESLKVDGETILEGAVIITVPQGDISMGIYQ